MQPLNCERCRDNGNARHSPDKLDPVNVNENLREVTMNHICISPSATTCYGKKWLIKSKYINRPDSEMRAAFFRSFRLCSSVCLHNAAAGALTAQKRHFHICAQRRALMEI